MTVPEREAVALDAAAVPSETAVAKPLGLWLDRRRLLIGAAVIAGLVAPLVVANFTIFQLTMVMIYGLAILGLNLLTGFNGQFSLGHSAFYGIGAYTAAILMSGSADLAYYWTLPCAGAVCFIVGISLGLPALRLQGLYLALATFALAVALPQLLKSHLLEGLTGGVQGIVIDKPDPPPGLPINADQWLYYFTLAVLLVMFAAAAGLVRSRWFCAPHGSLAGASPARCEYRIHREEHEMKQITRRTVLATAPAAMALAALPAHASKQYDPGVTDS